MRKALLLLVPALVQTLAMPAQTVAPNPQLIDSVSARSMIKAWEDQASSASFAAANITFPKSLKFTGPTIEALMAQKGAVGITWHLAINNGHMTLVGFAYDSTGAELPQAAENAVPCPPFCS